MGWNSQAVIAQLVIIEGPDDGLFVYSGTPAFGNLSDSITSMAGTDEFGNAYLAGTASYGSSAGLRTAVQLSTASGSGVTFYHATTAAGPWHAASQITADSVGQLSIVPSVPIPGGFTTLTVDGASPNTQGSAAEIQGPLAIGTAAGSIREFYTPSGGDDFAALDTALGTYGSADLVPGTYELSAQLPVAGATLQGCDMASIIKPFGGYAGALLAAGAKGAVRNLSLENCGANAIEITSGIAETWLEDLYFASNTGNCIHSLVTAPLHGRIRGIRGAGGGGANGGGIFLNGGTGAAVTCEVNIYDIDIQGCLTQSVLHFLSLTDVLVWGVNGSLDPANTNNALYIEGACQTVHLLGLDVGINTGGTPSGPAVLMIEQGTGNAAPTDCVFNGKVQRGAVGCIVNDASARLSFTDFYATRCQGDGFQANNTGAFNTLTNFLGNGNNAAAGTAYDVNITNTGHWLVDGMRGVSSGVTKNRNITQALNHVTVVNDPAGTTTAGNAPAGW